MVKRNIRLLLEYDGTNYHGWQSQENSKTIQDFLEFAIEKLTQEKIRVTASGRTDAGVHAKGQVVNFYIKKNLPIHNICMGLNTYLPQDIVVKNADEVDLNFNARFNAKKRVYQYYIMLDRTAIYRKFCWQIFQKLDISILKILAKSIVGEHDFSAFAKLEAQTESKICHVYESQWRTQADFLIYRIMANHFLHGMVRAIVGTMIDVARGRFTVEQFEKFLYSRDRKMAGESAPAQGLFLEEVIY